MYQSRSEAINLAKRLIIDVLWKTANIEVDGITFPQTEQIFDGVAPAGMTITDINVVNNIKRAWEFLFDHIESPLDWPFISGYNTIIGNADVINGPGKLREHSVRISGTDYVPPLPHFADIQADLRNIAQVRDPIEKALQLFTHVSRGQWFNDGNKRTAFLVANHTLIHEGIGVLSISPHNKPEFTTLLIHFYESGDSTELTTWMRDYAIGYLPGGLTLYQEQSSKN